MDPVVSPPGNAAPRSRVRGRLLLAGILLLVGLAGAVALDWHRRHEPPPPQPPQPQLAGADPVLVEAIATARAKVVRQPRSAAAWGLLGQVLYAHHYFEEAAVCFAQAEQLDPRDPRWPYLWGLGLVPRDLHAAIPHLQRAVELLDRKDDARAAARLRLAEALLALGRLDEAEPLLQTAQEQASQASRIHYDLGLLAIARQDWPTSRKHLERCLNSPDARQKAYSQLAVVSQRLGDTRAAAAFMQRATRLEKDLDWDDPFERTTFHLMVGKQDRFLYAEKMVREEAHAAEGIAVLRTLVQQYPDDYRLYISLAKALGKRGRSPEAQRLLRRAIALAPQRAQAYYFLSLSLFQQASDRWRQGDQARRSSTMSSSSRKQASDRWRQGDQAAARTLFQEAVVCARQAIDRKPDHALAHGYLGLSLWGLGRKEEAIRALRIAVQCGPETADPYLFLGQALAETGRPVEARHYLEHALRMAPEDPRVGAALAQLRQAKTGPPRPEKDKPPRGGKR